MEVQNNSKKLLIFDTINPEINENKKIINLKKKY